MAILTQTVRRTTRVEKKTTIRRYIGVMVIQITLVWNTSEASMVMISKRLQTLETTLLLIADCGIVP